MSDTLQIIPIRGIGEIAPGENLGQLIANALRSSNISLQQHDVIVVTQKIVSKAESRTVVLEEVEPSPFAQKIADQAGKDARQVEVVLQESKRVVRMARGIIISETEHGFVCANAGVDESNVDGARQVTLLPVDSDHSARVIQRQLLSATDCIDTDISIIISDTWGRPWRNGQVNMAIGIAGMEPMIDYRGQVDPYGYELAASIIAVADELAAAAELVMGKIDRVPVAIIRGYHFEPAEGNIQSLLRDSSMDMFR